MFQLIETMKYFLPLLGFCIGDTLQTFHFFLNCGSIARRGKPQQHYMKHTNTSKNTFQKEKKKNYLENLANGEDVQDVPILSSRCQLEPSKQHS